MSIPRADEERYIAYRDTIMRCIGSNADLCTAFIDLVSSQASPAFAEAYQTARRSRSLADFETFLKCLRPDSAESRKIVTAIAVFARDQLGRRWSWLCFELYLIFAETCIASIVSDANGAGPEFEIGCSLQSAAKKPLSESELESLKAITAAAVAGEATSDVFEKLEAFRRQLRTRITGSTEQKRYRPPNPEKLVRNAIWYYRVWLNGKSINSIANNLQSNSWAVVKDALKDVHRVLSLPIEESFA